MLSYVFGIICLCYFIFIYVNVSGNVDDMM